MTDVIGLDTSIVVRLLCGEPRKLYGRDRWRKMKGTAKVSIKNVGIYRVELHWYEAGNLGKKEYKIKRFLNE